MLRRLMSGYERSSVRDALSWRGMWRVCFAISTIVTLFRISPLGEAGPEVIWYVSQFGPLVVATALTFLQARHVHFGTAGWLLVGLVGLAFASSAWSSFPINTATQAVVMAIAVGFLCSTGGIRWLDRDDRSTDLKFLYWLITSTLMAGVLLWLFDSAAAMGFFSRYQGVFPNPNYAGIAAAISVPLGIWYLSAKPHRIGRLVVLSSLLVAFGTMAATGSRGPLIAAVIGGAVALMLSPFKRSALLALGGMVLGVGLILVVRPAILFGNGGFLDRSDQGSDFTSGRADIWGRVFELWRSHPVWGIGYRTVELLPSSADLNAHNIYLSVLVELGAVGLFLFLCFLAAILATGRKPELRHDRVLLGAVIVVMVNELTEASLFGFGGPTAFVCWLLLFAFSAGGRKPRSSVPVEAYSSAQGSPKVSVCIATYNGARFVEEQLLSILAQIGPNDEVVVVDDHSTDETVSKVRGIADPRIRVIVASSNRGHVATFERAVAEAEGEFILLSDQDDVWLPGRVAAMADALSGSYYVASNLRTLGSDATPYDGTPYEELSQLDTDRPWRNISRLFLGTIPYFGCAMGIRRDARDRLLPFPPTTQAHDHWIALMGNIDGRFRHIEEYTVARRVHDQNLSTSQRRPLLKVIRTRMDMLVLLCVAVSRKIRVRNKGQVTFSSK